MFSFYGVLVCLRFVRGEVLVFLLCFEIRMMLVWVLLMFVVIVFILIFDMSLMCMCVDGFVFLRLWMSWVRFLME